MYKVIGSYHYNGGALGTFWEWTRNWM